MVRGGRVLTPEKRGRRSRSAGSASKRRGATHGRDIRNVDPSRVGSMLMRSLSPIWRRPAKPPPPEECPIFAQYVEQKKRSRKRGKRKPQVRTRSFCSRVFRWLFYTILALELRPQFVTWSLTTLEYSDFRIKWKLLPPTVKSQPTMLGNITVSNPNLLPMWIHAASADIYYADKRGQRQLLGRGSAGNLTLYPGENFVQTFVAVEPMGVGDALSFERGGDKADGERVYLSAGTVTGALLGVLPFEINAECEQAVQVSMFTAVYPDTAACLRACGGHYRGHTTVVLSSSRWCSREKTRDTIAHLTHPLLSRAIHCSALRQAPRLLSPAISSNVSCLPLPPPLFSLCPRRVSLRA
mmetsp:Transcript_60544/g.136860  ORF Transcript_60544/g.136860 Transcript_60544/m.136860 type:complete len:354 (+) Transcript_60544:156-1217(+)